MTFLSATLGYFSPRWRTMNEWLVEYEKIIGLRNYSPQTLKNKGICIKHIRRLIGDRPLREIQPHHLTVAVKTFLPDRATTAQKIRDEMVDIFREAAGNGWCDKNPADFVKRPAAPVLRDRLEFEMWKNMRAAAAQHAVKWAEPMLLLALIIGQRRADLHKMRFDDVQDGMLLIEQQKKAGKKHGARIGLPLDLRLDEIGLSLGEVIEMCRHYAPPGPTLLRKRNGEPLKTLSMLTYRFAELIKPLGTWAPKKRPCLHECRSLSARMYKDQGDIDTQTLLGHKSPEMTKKYEDPRGLGGEIYKPLKLVKPSAIAVDQPAPSAMPDAMAVAA